MPDNNPDNREVEYSVDFWDVSVYPNVEALPPLLYNGDPAYDINPFVNTEIVYMIVGDHVLPNSLFESIHNDPAMYCEELYSLFNVQCVAMSKHLYETLHYTWPRAKINFISESMARNGKQFFADYRAAGKVWISNTEDRAHGPDGISPTENLDAGFKLEVAITDDIVQDVRDFMFLFAKETVEDEFERRYMTMAPSGKLEQASWETQKHEAREWLANQGQNGSRTPFLDYLATSHNRDKTALANKILEKAEAYEDQLSDLLVAQQRVIADFKAAQTVWDINIQYERYFGLAVPIKQAQQLGWTEGPESFVRTTQVPHGFQF
jgi:hypothetical protein